MRSLCSNLVGAASAGLLAMFACHATAGAGDRPLPVNLGRVQTLAQDNVTVRLAIPTEQDAAVIFGLPLAEHDLQPIWLRVDNASDAGYWLLPIAIDPDYYSADEAAYVAAGRHSQAKFTATVARFREMALPYYIGPGRVEEGYVYATHMRGGRFVDVHLTSDGRAVRLRFAVLLPTEGFDYERSALRERYSRVTELADLDIGQMREQLRALPCCTADADGRPKGDPLNVVLVGSGEEVIAALTASGWKFTEAITADSIRRMVGAAIAEKAMMTAPVSSLYAFGRKQDLALQHGEPSCARPRLEQFRGSCPFEPRRGSLGRSDA